MKTIMVPIGHLLLWIFCAVPCGLSAQFLISGKVVFGETLEPVPDYEVAIFLPVHDQRYTFLTNSEGDYEAGFAWTSAEILEAVVEVVDLCTGEVKSRKLPNADGGYEANFQLCQGVNPPPPPPGCQAHFFYEQIEVNPPTVLFLDLSYSGDPKIMYFWDFGDGNSSEEPAPTHEFPAPGLYEVSLKIETENCNSSSILSVVVSDSLDCVCTTVYNPVCVTLDDSTRITFSNDCLARCAGFKEGDWSSCEPNNCSCPEFYDPVCVAGPNGDTLTFSNLCFAECAGYGADQVYPCNPINECDCAPVDAPVCVINAAGEILRFPNACLAECAGFPASSIIDCGAACICPEYYSPVCVVVNGDTLTYANYCFAACDGYGADEVFACNPNGACDCSDEYDPVCAHSPEGIILTFQNSCVAHCRGYTDDQLFSCEGECVCPAVYDPVCVINTQGERIVFGNRCEAECAGYSDDQIFKCDGSECNCIEIYDPVCVVVNGVTRTFDNECFALCEGFTPDQIFKCEPGGCDCPEIYSPVCIVTDFGPAYWFVNECEAQCAGFGPDEYESCGPDDCICPDVIDPVCVIDVQGDSLWFSNSCEAICAGFPEDELFKCDLNNPCNCDAVYDPVCIFTPGGTVIRFANECEARCAGYDENHWVKCEDTYCQSRFGIVHLDEIERSVQFVNRSEPIGDPGIEWHWNFGDGSESKEQDPVHVYSHEGVFEVVLTMTSPSGCTSTYHEKVVVGIYEPLDSTCKALFFFDQDPADPFFFQFHDMSLGNIVSWEWYFGDGVTSDEPAPQHTYSQAGIYIVSLSVTAADGCTNLVSMLVATDENIVYNSDCHALFLPIFSPDSNQVFFLNFSTAGVVQTLWDFGDGTTSDQLMPAHQYETPDIYTVTLTIVTAGGCENSYTAIINIAGANFTAAPEYEFRSATDAGEEEWLPETVRLYPNPVGDQLWIDLEDHPGGPTRWRILSLGGKLVQQGQQEMSAGHQKFSVSTADLPAGLYVLQIVGKNGMIGRKFVKY